MDSIFEQIEGASQPLQIALYLVCGLLFICLIASLVTNAWLAIKYVKYNRRKNSIQLSGNEVARKILDDNGLNHIKVKTSGSLMFGNSYSHYFKKVRLRRLTAKKKSISALAMASQKSELAILDKENDPEMRRRVRLTPILYFGPFLWLPILFIGVLIDIIFFSLTGWVTIAAALLGLSLYVIYFVLALSVLKTEKHAQANSLKRLKDSGMATEEEILMLKELYKLYNIQYVLDIITAALELIKQVLIIAIQASNNKNSTNHN